MNRRHALTLAVALTAGLATPAVAQRRLTLRAGSQVTLAGSSNVHGWSCGTSTLSGVFEVDSLYASKPLSSVARPITAVSVTIPVKSLKCGKGKMDDNMYKALRADEFPEIRYVLGSTALDSAGTAADTLAALTTGELTVAGQTAKVRIPVTAVRGTGGSMTATGSVRLLMTDFGIKPPVALLGTLRTKNEIEVSFTIVLDRAAVVALSP